MLDINFLTAIKRRVMYELRSAINQHVVFRGTEVYHKFPYTERPERAIVLRNVSSTRIRLSPDDFAGTVKSYVMQARAGNHKGSFLQWTWENREKITETVVGEDLSAQISGTAALGTNRFFETAYKPLMAGPGNSNIADNFRQIELKLNGAIVHAEMVDGSRGLIALPNAPVVGDTLTVSYFRSIMSPSGRYYIEIVDAGHFMVDPLLQVKKEEVLESTTGLEETAQLSHGNLLPDSDILYLSRGLEDDRIYLERGTDYTILASGLITFLVPLSVGFSLYADYRYIADSTGPHEIPSPLHYNDTAIPGTVLCFNNQIEVGDKAVVLVLPERELSASFYMGHWQLNLDIDVYARHPEEVSEVADHLINDVWDNRCL
jgi:hypothetical protein